MSLKRFELPWPAFIVLALVSLVSGAITASCLTTEPINTQKTNLDISINTCIEKGGVPLFSEFREVQTMVRCDYPPSWR